MDSQESGPSYSSHRSFTSDRLYSADRLCPHGIDGGENSHQLPGYLTSYLATPEETESLTNGICMTNPRMDSDWFSLANTSFHSHQSLCPGEESESSWSGLSHMIIPVIRKAQEEGKWNKYMPGSPNNNHWSPSLNHTPSPSFFNISPFDFCAQLHHI